MRGLRDSRKQRHGQELVCERVFRPLAQPFVLAMLPLRVPPPAVVVLGACTGVAGATAIGTHHFALGALLLQLKTVLDNADGQLARLSGRVTAFGRYLDSELDLLVNAALSVALAVWIGPWLALASFVALTFVLGVNFNAERLYRAERGEVFVAMPEAEGAGALLARIYRVVYGPQDRLAEWFTGWRLRDRSRDARLAWHDPLSVNVIANFGLSTQLAALGACLGLGLPALYAYLTFACALALVGLLLRRELLARRAGRTFEPLVVVE